MRIKVTTLLAGFTALGIGQAALAATFYTTGTLFPNSGSAWNTAANGSGTNGFSVTYNFGTEDLIFQSGDEIYTANSGTGFGYKAASYTFDGIGLVNNATPNAIGTFDGGDITVTANGATFLHGTVAGAGSAGGGVGGTSNVQLGSNTISFKERFSSNSGIYDFGLNVVGNGTLDLGFASALMSWEFSNLSTDFTGTILGDTFNGSLILAPGNGASAASVVISRAGSPRPGKLDLTGDFSIGALSIDGMVIADGVYTYDQLIALNAGYSDNLIDNNGRVFVGQLVPEPASLAVGMIGLGGLAMRRRREA